MKTKHFNFSFLRCQLLILSCLIMGFVGYAQLEFRGVSPSQIAHPFEFTYTSNTQYLDAWGGDIEAPGFYLEGILTTIESDTLGCLNYNKDLTDKIALIYRGECTFFEKIYSAQQHGAKAVVIVNNIDEPLFFMTGGATDYLVNIPAVLISKEDGEELRLAMEVEEVSVMLSNMQNYFNYNLSIDKEYALMPFEYATPISTIDELHPYTLPLGAFIFNRGSNDINYANLTATITLGDSVIYEASYIRSVLSEDTLFFELPDFTCGNLKIGTYKLIYHSSIEENEDQDPFSDTIVFHFQITENTFSLVPLNNNKEPISNHYTTTSSQDLVAIKQCVKFENENASKIAAEGIYFSVQNEYENLNNQEILISCYAWNNVFNQDAPLLNSNFTNLTLLDETYLYIEDDGLQKDIYTSFNDFILLENNKKYLFCVSPTSNPDILIGYNNELDYSLNNFAYNESIHPVEIKTGMNQQKNWYNGFSSGVTPSIALKTIDIAKLEIIENTSLKVNVYPNPVIDQLTVELESIENNAQINVIDISGKIIITEELLLNNGVTNFNMKSLENGMYIVKIQLKNGQNSVFNIIKNN